MQEVTSDRLGWTITDWLDAYRSQRIDPHAALQALRSQLPADDPAWIHILTTSELDKQLESLPAADVDKFPLYGVPYVVKDNMDVAGLPTTAGCPAYSYIATEDATVVKRLRLAGAVVIAKANMDQFATGLVGTRSPYGAVPNSFDPNYVSGGSSSGSAVSVARGLVPFSLGTDTAGSGRVPAGFNNIVGLKPTKGRFSIKGVVPACRTLDCVSVFALTVNDAESVALVLEGYDAEDGYSRVVPQPATYFGRTPRFGVPQNPNWYGDAQSEKAWQNSIKQFELLGVQIVPLDFSPMEILAKLLYGGPWVAERHAAISAFMSHSADKMDQTVRGIVEKASTFTATDAYSAEYRRAELARDIQAVMRTVDALLVPTAPTLPTIAQVKERPVEVNSLLGTYTNFVNLADCSALAMPAGLREDGLPFGITLIAAAWQDAALAQFGRYWEAETRWSLGATNRKPRDVAMMGASAPPRGYIRIAVVGAHLSGMPLNTQLTERNALFVESTLTANIYRLVHLPRTSPPKPGLIQSKDGSSIIVELWDLPLHLFGGFVELIAPPLGIGTLTLADGRLVKGFICEGLAAESASDVTVWGGWRAYINHCTRLSKRNDGVFNTVLIANRGEIAVRIGSTLKKMGIKSVAIYSDADRNSAHVTAANVAIGLGGNQPADNYLNGDLILATAIKAGAQAIIPGYGFLSENSAFAAKVEAAGLSFVGPTPKQITQFGLKHTSRELASKEGVPLSPGTGLLVNVGQAVAAAVKIGYPVMLKSTAGGGGIGLMRCNDESELVKAFDAVKRLSEKFFNDGGVFLERFIANARHIEVQFFGDGKGNVKVLGERDCSLQRRNQKVVEETPAPKLSSATRSKMFQVTSNLAKAVNYRSAGTIEFMYDETSGDFFFMEVNSRLQVEHAITEAVTGLDLVEWMILIAEGQPPRFDTDVIPKGSAMEVRIYAEEAAKDFLPSPGVLTDVYFPLLAARVDTWVSTGTEVSSYYDSMIAKIIVHGRDRADTLNKLREVLNATRLAGISTNLEYLRQVIATPFFVDGNLSTTALSNFEYLPPIVEVIAPGTYTSVQDYPGRVGYWRFGVSPSGPMDDYAFRLANRIVGNHPDAAALEITIVGPKLRFHVSTVIALTGAHSDAKLDSKTVEYWTPVIVKAHQVLDVGKVDTGCRIYLAVRNGFEIPVFLGSRSTFALGQFGGHAGRILRSGDMLNICRPELEACSTPAPITEYSFIPKQLIPQYTKNWNVGVLYGPHGAPDFLTDEAIEIFFSTDWEVHYNSNRLGIRLNGPKLTWSRSNGGEAGLHPSNIHDTMYAIGTVNFTGDTPIILTKDGPSLGGFVCPVTIATAELWKIGQVKPGDKIRFRCISFDTALGLELATDKAIANLSVQLLFDDLPVVDPGSSSCILASRAAEIGRPEVVYRQAGDKYILVEYGANVMDLCLRFCVHAFMEALTKENLDGIIELSPGVRSFQIQYDCRIIHQTKLIFILLKIEATLTPVDNMVVPSRIVYLPMMFEGSAVQEALSRYRQSVRDTAPWLPSNVEFIRRINGLDSIENVRDILYSSSFLVLGMGDVYLGAPCAVPIDPRHRLSTSKYNPARTFTAEGSVGIGGVYMCTYGMDSPGGYQLVGRTLPIWNNFTKNRAFTDGEPWLLRFFDRVQFYPIDEKELDIQRDQFREGRFNIRIEEEEFRLADYTRFLEENAESIEEFKSKQQAAFNKEVTLWENTVEVEVDVEASEMQNAAAVLEGRAVTAEISGSIWKVLVEAGQQVHVDQPLIIVEAMKMEFSVDADREGKVISVNCVAGNQIKAGDLLVVLTE